MVSAPGSVCLTPPTGGGAGTTEATDTTAAGTTAPTGGVEVDHRGVACVLAWAGAAGIAGSRLGIGAGAVAAAILRLLDEPADHRYSFATRYVDTGVAIRPLLLNNFAQRVARLLPKLRHDAPPSGKGPLSDRPHS